MTATILSSNVLCAIGRGPEQAWASARAGIARIGNSHVMDRNFDPIRMGLVPDEALMELPESISSLPLPSRARRMLRLAAPALQGLDIGNESSLRLFLGVPQLSEAEAPWLKYFPRYLEMLTGLPIDVEASVVVPQGRAAAFVALEQAVSALQGDPRPLLVGGIDTFLDLRLLAALDAEHRILGPRVNDGFIPGEGAAFLLIGPARRSGVEILGVTSVQDPGHRYGSAPARGEGLASAITQLRGVAKPPAPVGVTFAGFNGESFDAKLWGVAQLRHRDFFAASALLEHPADKYGDAGAATGAILVGLAATALTDASRAGPAFIWAASDYDPLGCALLALTN